MKNDFGSTKDQVEKNGKCYVFATVITFLLFLWVALHL